MDKRITDQTVLEENKDMLMENAEEREQVLNASPIVEDNQKVTDQKRNGEEKKDKMEEEEKEVAKNSTAEKDDDDSEELSEDEYEVEQILDVAAKNGEVKYLVRWVNYGSDEDSWEPERNLETAKLLLDEYVASHQDKVNKAIQAADGQGRRRKKQKKKLKPINKNTRKSNRSRRSESKGDSEVSETSSTWSSKRLKMDESIRERSADADVYNEDYEENPVPSRKRSRRAAAAESETKKVSMYLSVEGNKKIVSKELTPKNAKNAWLYDDPDDGESDASERSDKVKKKDGSSPKKEKASIRGRVKVVEKKEIISIENKQNDNDSNVDKKKAGHGNQKSKKEEPVEKATAKKSENKQVEKDVRNEYVLDSEAEVEFVGVVKCHDGAIKVVYRKKGNERAHVVSVREAYELDGYGFVQYLISRCEFGEP